MLQTVRLAICNVRVLGVGGGIGEGRWEGMGEGVFGGWGLGSDGGGGGDDGECGTGAVGLLACLKTLCSLSYVT